MTVGEEILIVEDSRSQAEYLRLLLEAGGFDVRLAGDGYEALEALEQRIPALVITDVVMPGMDGYALCECIKSDEAFREIPVILLTALSEPQDIVKSLQCGADNFIRKPYDERHLLARVRNILSSRELRDGGGLQMGLQVHLAGQRHFIGAERQQILDFLLSTYEDVAQVNEALAAKTARLHEANEELERRSAEVERANHELRARQLELEQALRNLDWERRRAQELADVNRAVLDATTDGIALFDSDGKRVLANAALREMRRALPGAGDFATIEDLEAIASHAADPAGLNGFVSSMTADPERDARCELELPTAGRHLCLYAAPVRDRSGRLIGRIVVVRDDTAEHQAERLKAELLATVSHELRTPLASVLGFAELLVSRDLDEHARTRYVKTIATEAQRLTDLLNDFLDLHRSEQGWFSIAAEPLDLADVVRQQVQAFSGQSAAHALTLQLPERPLPVLGEHDRLAQVLANLLSNAVKYSPEGGPVEVIAQERGDAAVVSIRDSGLGIPLAHQDKVFTKFFRVDSSQTRSIGGTGLGLALAREIVDAHGGEVGFESEEGVGTRFWFRLPLVQLPEPARSPLPDHRRLSASHSGPTA